jgi:hypothetical protein
MHAIVNDSIAFVNYLRMINGRMGTSVIIDGEWTVSEATQNADRSDLRPNPSAFAVRRLSELLPSTFGVL